MTEKLLLFTVLIALLGFASLSLADTVLPNPLCSPGSKTCIDNFPSLIETIAKYIRNIIGSLAIVMFLWAGILFVTSAGNEGRLGNAKKALWWAVVGTAIALAGEGLISVIRAVIGTSS